MAAALSASAAKVAVSYGCENRTGLWFVLYSDGTAKITYPVKVTESGEMVNRGSGRATPILYSDGTWAGRLKDVWTASYITQPQTDAFGNHFATTVLQPFEIPDVVAYQGRQYVIDEIGDFAFFGSNVTYVKIGDNIKRIGKYAFAYSAYVGSEHNTDYAWLVESKAVPDGCTELGDYVWAGCSNVQGLIIGDGVKVIPEHAFLNCGRPSALGAAVRFGKSVEAIEGSFDRCVAAAFASPVPPAMYASVFSRRNGFTACVPEGSLSQYNQVTALTGSGAKWLEYSWHFPWGDDMHVRRGTRLSVKFNKFPGVYSPTFLYGATLNGHKVAAKSTTNDYYDAVTAYNGTSKAGFYMIGGSVRQSEPMSMVLEVLDDAELGTFDLDCLGPIADVTFQYPRQRLTVHEAGVNVEGISLQLDGEDAPSSLVLPEDAADFDLSATIYPSNSTCRSVHWTSTRPDILEIDQQGHVTVKSTGAAQVQLIATADDPCDAHVKGVLNVRTGSALPVTFTYNAYVNGTNNHTSVTQTYYFITDPETHTATLTYPQGNPVTANPDLVPSDLVPYNFSFAGAECFRHYGAYDPYDEITGAVKIPQTITSGGETYTVTAIGDFAFYGSNLQYMQLPSTVTSIGQYAFASSSYKGDALTSRTLRNEITSIGTGLFKNCSQLEAIDFGDGITVIPSETLDGATPTQIGIGAAVNSIEAAIHPSLEFIAFRSEVPPMLSLANRMNIQYRQVAVPAGCVETYTTAYSLRGDVVAMADETAENIVYVYPQEVIRLSTDLHTPFAGIDNSISPVSHALTQTMAQGADAQSDHTHDQGVGSLVNGQKYIPVASDPTATCLVSWGTTPDTWKNVTAAFHQSGAYKLLLRDMSVAHAERVIDVIVKEGAPLQSIKLVSDLSQEEVTEIEQGLGTTSRLKAIPTPANTDLMLAWSSSDPDVVSVNDNGEFSIHDYQAGEVTLTATSVDPASDSSIKATVNVRPKVEVAATGIAMTLDGKVIGDKREPGSAQLLTATGQADITSRRGASLWLGAIVYPENASVNNDMVTHPVDWAIEGADSELATVDRAGTVTLKGGGDVKVRASVRDGSGVSSILTIHSDIYPTDIAIDLSDATLPLNERGTLHASIANASEVTVSKNVIWTSSDASVLAVEPDGTFEARGLGRVTVTAASAADESIRSTMDVTVTHRYTTALAMDCDYIEGRPGDTRQLHAEIDKEATYDRLTWSSDNTDVATVSAEGLVTLVADGNTTVRVAADGTTLIATCDVCVNTNFNPGVTGIDEIVTISGFCVNGREIIVTGLDAAHTTSIYGMDGTLRSLINGNGSWTAPSAGVYVVRQADAAYKVVLK